MLDAIRKTDAKVNQKAECEIKLSLGQAYRHLGQIQETASTYENVLEIASAAMLGPDVTRRALGNLALVKIDLGEYDQAEAELKRLAHDYERNGDYRLSAHAAFNVAYSKYRRGDFAEAIREGERSATLLKQIDDPSLAQIEEQLQEWNASLKAATDI